MDPIALTAGEQADFFLLVSPGEVEFSDIGTAVHLLGAQPDGILAVGDRLPDGLLRIKLVTALVNIGELDRFSQAYRAGIGCFLADNHLEEGALARPIRADDTDDSARRQAEVHVFDQEAIAKTL